LPQYFEYKRSAGSCGGVSQPKPVLVLMQEMLRTGSSLKTYLLKLRAEASGQTAASKEAELGGFLSFAMDLS
jgi:hypothetical protein